MASVQLADHLERRYRTSLAVVTVLVLGNQALVQPYLMRLTTDAPWINEAGRQRMLSQRLAKAVLVLEHARGPRASAARAEIREVLGIWTVAHDRLLRGGVGGRHGDRNSPAVRAELASLEPDFAAMSAAARRLIAASPSERPDAPSVERELAVILDHEAGYLRRMDRVVGLYEREARARVETFRRLGWLLTGLTLAGLAAIGRFSFRPASEMIRGQVAELARAHDELEDRVRQRTRELEEARERHRTLLEQSSHVGRTTAVGEMASALAHELNQPLGAIANYAEGCLIALDAPRPALGEVREALLRLRETSLRAGRILDQVRRFVTRQGPARETFDANQVVRDAVEILGAEVHRHQVSLRLELASGLPSLQGDPVQIQQVLVNLVRNALESLAQSQTSEPTVVIWTEAAGDDGVEIGVRDNGEGIAPEHRAQIFDAYFSTRAGGMGMGLAICRTIAEAHQGRILVASEPGIRTSFRIQLPAVASGLAE